MTVKLCAGLSHTAELYFCQHSSTIDKHASLLVTPGVTLERFMFCFNKTVLPIAQTDFLDRKNASCDHDFTTAAVAFGNQRVRDRRLIGSAVIIIT